MPQFTLPNVAAGGTTTVTAPDLASAQQAAASQTGVSLAAQQGGGTFGANTFGGGVGTTGGTNTAGGGAAAGGGGDLSGLAAFGAQTSGVTAAQLAQQKQEFDAQLQFARDQMEKLGIPQLQINQQLAQLQQQQFQAQLALAAQSQQYTQAATNAGLTGWLYPTAPVPNVSQFTGPLSNQGGGTSWNQLSNYMQQQAGGNYNDQAAKTAFAQAIGTTPNNLSGQVGQNLNQAQLSQIMAAGGVPQNALGGTPGTAGGGGGVTWNQLSGLLQQQAGGNYNDAAGKNAFMQAYGVTPSNFNGSTEVLTDPNALNGIVSAASGGQIQSYGALPGAPSLTGQTTGAPNPNLPQQTLAGQQQQAVLSGMYQGAPTEAAREFNQNLALQQGQLGQQYLATAAQLQGPQNTFQLQNYLQGAQGNPNVPVYLQNLASNTKTPGFQQAGTTAPTVQSAQGLGGQLAGGQSATPGWNLGQTQNTLRGLMGNAQGLAPGSIESLNPDQLAALGSGLGSVGGTLPSFLQQYANSRIGQQAPVAQARLA